MIPLFEPFLDGNEWKYVKDCLDSNWISSVGEYVRQFELAAEAYTGTKHAIATSSGTAGLEMALRIAGVRKGDYVIVSNLTFVATLNAIYHLGARPILLDVDRHTWQPDLDLLGSFLQDSCYVDDVGEVYVANDRKRLAAFVPVHVLGNIGDMHRMWEILAPYRLTVVEDAAEAVGTTLNGKHAGTFGLLGCMSFNGNKIITTGGGGMIITNNETLAQQARHLRAQAKVEGIEYVHDEIAYNYGMSAVTAAIGLAQWEQLPQFLERKRWIAGRYREALQDLAWQGCLPEVNPNNWLPTAYVEDRVGLLQHLQRGGVQARPLWVPMNRLKMFEDLFYIQSEDVSYDLYAHCVSLPGSSGLTEQQVAQVIEAVRTFLQSR